jgi:hypothetical protein
MNPRLSFITDLVLFQVAWFGCVLATRSPFPQLLPILVLLLVLVRVHQTRGLASVLPFTFSCLILGVIGDATLVHLDLLFFEPYPSLFGAPLWMVALWLNFGLMLRPIFTWFLDHSWRAFIGFSVGGVVAYYSGQKLGVLTLSVDIQSHLGVAVEWAIAGLVLRYLHLKFPIPE